MFFSNPVFLFVFFPITFLIYWKLNDRYKNGWLLFCSLFFYAWSGIESLLILLFSTLVNYILGEKLAHKNKVALWFGVSFNLGLLVFFKYTKFIFENVCAFIPGRNVESIPLISELVLPLGISFFTFRILAYDIDVYYQKVPAQNRYSKLLLFVVMFPWVVQGPIVRYTDVEQQINERSINYESIYAGLRRFINGLAKKVLLADVLGGFTETIFASGGGTLVAWLGMLAYSLQLYFDFAGYSDMAIGMGKMLGFDFSENFDNPYQSKSIKEFWRRWHISLSSWFRDYLYIPLGGNRKGKLATYKNLAIVFLATGIWHGASWNFVIWGLWHGFFLIIERVGFGKILEKLPAIIRRIYALLIVGIGWLMFRTEDLKGNLTSIVGLFKYEESAVGQILTLFDAKVILSFAFGIILCVIGTKKRIKNGLVGDIITLGLFLIALLQISTSNFSPFLYFRF